MDPLSGAWEEHAILLALRFRPNVGQLEIFEMTLDQTRGTGPFERALAAQENASQVGFDWPDISGVFEKLDEEIAEIKAAIDADDGRHAKRELGDLLFTVVNLSRFLNADPVRELNAATETFLDRFLHLQTELQRTNRRIEDCSLGELDVVWEQVKKSASFAQKKA